MTEEQVNGDQASETNLPEDATQTIDVSSLSEVGDVPNMNFNRKFRRMLLKRGGYIKMKSKLGYNDWFENIRNNAQNGKQLQATNTEDVIKTTISYIDNANESTAKFLSEKGYAEEDVAAILERNMKVQEKIASKKLKP